jgi:hypothetical protein
MITYKSCPLMREFKIKTLTIIVTICLICLLSNATFAQKQSYPEAEISNSLIKAKIYLPDAKKGYYQSTRFDWSGAIHSVQYKNYSFYEKWYDRIDPKVINWVYDQQDIVSGPCSGLFGPVEEFETPLGWDETKPGGTFIKIGVGILKKVDEKNNRYMPYEVLDSGRWSVKKKKESIEFTQELTDPGSGYAYVYKKLVRLIKNKPTMVIEHKLVNTGKIAIHSDVYNHNFVVINKQTPGPDYTIKFPFELNGGRSLHKELAEIKGNQINYLKKLSDKDEAVVFLQGFSNKPSDNEVVVENKNVGAGIKIKCNRPLIKGFLWSVRSVLAIEPYISIDVEPGKDFSWNNTFEYYETK